MKRLFGGTGFLSSWQLFFAVAYSFFFFALLLFKKQWGISITLFEIAHLFPVFLASNNKSPFFYAKVFLAIGLTVFFWTRADHVIQVLSLLTVIGLNYIIFQEARTGKLVTPAYLFEMPFIWLSKAIDYTSGLFKFLFSWQSNLRSLKGRVQLDAARRVLVGILFSLPFIFILIILFSSADQNFQNIFDDIFKRIGKLFNFEWLLNLTWLWDAVWQFGIFWLYLCLVFPFEDRRKKIKTVFTKRVVEKMTIGIMVASVFAIFIVTQFKSVNYILEGFRSRQISPGAFVREGFFQLLIASLVGISVFNILKRDVGKSILTITLLVEIFLVSLVAGERVWLYQYQFGLTQMRVWGTFALLFIFTVIAALFLHLYKRITNQTKWQIYLIGFAAILVFAGLVNVDRVIAGFKPPVVDFKVDYDYMSKNLSYDAADYWVEQLEDVKPGELDEEKYRLLRSLKAYIWSADGRGNRAHNLSNFDINVVCGQKEMDWLERNISVSENRRKLCDNYEKWMDLMGDYEKKVGFLKKTHIPITVKVLNIKFPRPSTSWVHEPELDVINEISKGSKYKGQGESALNYEIVETKVVDHAPKKQVYNWVDYNEIIREFGVCGMINSGEIDEVWVWINGEDAGGPGRITSGPVIGRPQYGYDPNATFTPCGDRTITMMVFDYKMSRLYYVELMAERFEEMMMSLKPDEFGEFSSNPSSPYLITPFKPRVANGVEIYACGSASIPPNATVINGVVSNISFDNSRVVNSDCDDWNYNRTGKYTSITCAAWGCHNLGYYSWWMQHIPGIDNKLTDKDGKPMTNWWYAYGKYDEYSEILKTI